MPYSPPDGDAVEFEFAPSTLELGGIVPKLYLSDLGGTLVDSFRVNRAFLEAANLTSARIQSLQDRAGIIALTDDIWPIPTGRLTLESGVAVPVTDQLAKTSVYYTPHVGVLAPVYDGADFGMHAYTQLTQALDSDSGHTGYHQSGKNFDLFVVNDAGTLRLGTGPAWTSDTARGTGAGTTEIERKNGLWTNKVSMTLRWGSSSGNTITVAANQGTYVGTMRASANGQCEDSLAKRFLWNAYHRVPRAMRVVETTDSWTYSSSTWRQMNNSVANQLAMVSGMDEDAVKAITAAYAATSSAVVINVFNGIGLDVVNAFTGRPGNNVFNSNFSGVAVFQASYFGVPGLGYHFLAALEQGSGTASTETFYGDAGQPLNFQLGIHGEVQA